MSQPEDIFAHFHDIITPPPVSLFPHTPGYVALAILLAAALFPIGLRAWKRHRRNRYRREARAELARLRAMASPRAQLLATLRLLKRAAIVAYGRGEAAALEGERWWRFLHETSGIVLAPGLQAYCAAVYGDGARIDRERNGEVMAYAGRWLKRHRSGAID